MRYATSIAVSLGLVILVGCGDGGHVPAKGVIKWEDGTPIAGADIRLIPKNKDKGEEATAFSDAQGQFSVATGVKDGARRGDYTVVVTKFSSGVDTEKLVNPGEDAKPEDRIKAMQGMMKKGKGGPTKNELPAIYADGDKSPLSVTIPPPGDKIELTIKKKS